MFKKNAAEAHENITEEMANQLKNSQNEFVIPGKEKRVED